MSSRVTPFTSPAPGSTSRGTPMSTTSSARPVAARHHRLDRRCARRARPARRSTRAARRRRRARRRSRSSGIARAADAGGELLGLAPRCGWRRRSRATPAPAQRERHALAHARRRRARAPGGRRASRAARRPAPPRPTTPTPVPADAGLGAGPLARPRPRGGTCATSSGPLAASRSAACHASRTWPRISPSPMIIESRPAATPKRCATAASSWYV